MTAIMAARMRIGILRAARVQHPSKPAARANFNQGLTFGRPVQLSSTTGKRGDVHGN